MSKQPFSVVFAGTSDFAVPSLRALATDSSFAISLVITQPDRPAGRKGVLTPPPVKEEALKRNLPVFQPERLNNEWAQHSDVLKNCDFLIVASYGQILSQEVLDLPKVMPVNVHASLLPRWRGASPIQHAILLGDTKTGVTIQKMVHKLDAGPILGQESTPVDEHETWQSLHDRLALMGAPLLLQTLKGELNPKEQDEAKMTKCGLLTRADGTCDSESQTAAEIDRKVRALNPWPGVTMKADGVMLKILETSLESKHNAMTVNCKDASTLYLVKIQEPGKKVMAGMEWARGKGR